MTRSVLAILALCLTVTACGRVADSRLNPFNWFGRDRDEQAEVVDERFINDPRQFVAQVTSLQVDPTPEGAIIRTVGLPPVQGFWDAELVEVDIEDPTTLTYEFRVAPPPVRTRQGTVQSREIIAGAAVSNRRLATVRTITVIGQSNRRAVRR
ncbi:hypothetical protein C8N43_0363 [Litoreibacter ponti]|uniref:Lipoprotein n=1 Tax=Litoreibacter ponti TaxID=1510457 RepID=A0A2T6BI32_9RHOB|nr:hypothetical protein [Litoreibacter ponti]PTX55721.1 hypothetical protein C8N43_0363 [Litoreibacter ponti]